MSEKTFSYYLNFVFNEYIFYCVVNCLMMQRYEKLNRRQKIFSEQPFSQRQSINSYQLFHLG